MVMVMVMEMEMVLRFVLYCLFMVGCMLDFVASLDTCCRMRIYCWSCDYMVKVEVEDISFDVNVDK